MALTGVQDALWVPHSSEILASDGKEERRIVQRDPAEGNEREVARLASVGRLFDLSQDGKVLLYRASFSSPGSLQLGGPPEARIPIPLFPQPATIYSARFSPDGKWFVYAIAEEGSTPIYVQRFPPRGLRSQLTERGLMPVWRADGREILFFRDGMIYSIAVKWTNGEFRGGAPEALFKVRTTETFSSDSCLLDVTKDGSRILFAQGVEQVDPRVMYVMTSFDRMLKP